MDGHLYALTDSQDTYLNFDADSLFDRTCIDESPPQIPKIQFIYPTAQSVACDMNDTLDNFQFTLLKNPDLSNDENPEKELDDQSSPSSSPQLDGKCIIVLDEECDFLELSDLPNKAIKIDEDLRIHEGVLTASSNFANEDNIITSSPKIPNNIEANTLNRPCSIGFQTASGSKIQISEDKILSYKNMFEKEESPKTCQKTKLPFEGFSSASGKKIEFSPSKISKAKRIFNDLDDNMNQKNPLQSDSIFTTASGKKMLVSSERLNNFKDMLANLDEKESFVQTPARKSGLFSPSNLSKETLSSEKLHSHRKEANSFQQENKPFINPFKSCVYDLSDNKETPNRVSLNRTCFPTRTSSTASPGPIGISTVGKHSTLIISDKALSKGKKLIEDAIFSQTSPNIRHYPQKVVESPIETLTKNQKSVSNLTNVSSSKLEAPNHTLQAHSTDFISKREKLIKDQNLVIEKALLQPDILDHQISKKTRRPQKVILEPRIPGILWKQSRKNNWILERIKSEINPDNDKFLWPPLLTDDVPDWSPFSAAYVRWKVDECYKHKFEKQLPVYYKFGESEIILVPGQDGCIGHKEISRAFMASGLVMPKLVTHRWFQHHYAQLMWKIGSRLFLLNKDDFNWFDIFSHDSPSYHSLNTIILQLKLRYDLEIECSYRSVLRRIVERDDSSQRSMTLTISKFSREHAQIKACLSDGWYHINWEISLDSIFARYCRVGQKLITSGAELISNNSKLAVSRDKSVSSTVEDMTHLWGPDNSENKGLCVGHSLRLYPNSTRIASYETKLGIIPSDVSFFTKLSTLKPNGGLVMATQVLISRVFGLEYMETSCSSEESENSNLGIKRVFRNSRVENLAQKEYENKRQKLVDRVSEKYSLRNIKNTNGKIFAPEKLGNDGKVIFDAIHSASNSSQIIDALTERQSLELREYCRKSIEEEVNSQISPRNVIQVLKARIQCIYSVKFVALLTFWNITEELESFIREGTALTLRHVNVNFSRNSDPFFGSQCSNESPTNRTSSVEKLDLDPQIKQKLFSPRNSSNVSTVCRLVELWTNEKNNCKDKELDCFGVVICTVENVRLERNSDQLLDRLDQIYITDENKMSAKSCILQINVWGGFDSYQIKPLLEPGNKVSFKDLVLKSSIKSFSNEYSSSFLSSASYTRASEISIRSITRSNRENNLLISQDMQSWCNLILKDYVSYGSVSKFQTILAKTRVSLPANLDETNVTPRGRKRLGGAIRGNPNITKICPVQISPERYGDSLLYSQEDDLNTSIADLVKTRKRTKI